MYYPTKRTVVVKSKLKRYVIFGLNVVIFCKRSQQQARLDEAMLLIPPRTELWERLQTTSCNISLFLQ